MALKFAGKFKVGAYIRAYDFKPCPGRPDSYIEGRVTATNSTMPSQPADCYEVKIEFRCFGGKLKAEDDIGYVPHEVSFMEYDFRVVELMPAAA